VASTLGTSSTEAPAAVGTAADTAASVNPSSSNGVTSYLNVNGQQVPVGAISYPNPRNYVTIGPGSVPNQYLPADAISGNATILLNNGLFYWQYPTNSGTNIIGFPQATNSATSASLFTVSYVNGTPYVNYTDSTGCYIWPVQGWNSDGTPIFTPSSGVTFASTAQGSGGSPVTVHWAQPTVLYSDTGSFEVTNKEDSSWAVVDSEDSNVTERGSTEKVSEPVLSIGETMVSATNEDTGASNFVTLPSTGLDTTLTVKGGGAGWYTIRNSSPVDQDPGDVVVRAR